MEWLNAVPTLLKILWRNVETMMPFRCKMLVRDPKIHSVYIFYIFHQTYLSNIMDWNKSINLYNIVLYVNSWKKNYTYHKPFRLEQETKNSKEGASSSVLAFRHCSDRFTQYSISDLSFLPKKKRTPTSSSLSPSSISASLLIWFSLSFISHKRPEDSQTGLLHLFLFIKVEFDLI